MQNIDNSEVTHITLSEEKCSFALPVKKDMSYSPLKNMLHLSF
jgi:hypothetical protein